MDSPLEDLKAKRRRRKEKEKEAVDMGIEDVDPRDGHEPSGEVPFDDKPVLRRIKLHGQNHTKCTQFGPCKKNSMCSFC